jgi:peptidoglycan-associated lipoprotein
MHARTATRWAFTLLLPAILVGPGCKKKPPAPVAPPPPPTVEVRLQVASVSPNSVPPDAAASVTVYGSAFEDGASVSFGGNPGTEVRVTNSNQLSVTAPAMALGTYDVKVTNASGENATLRGGLVVKNANLACRSVTVNFDFDSSNLRSDSRSSLDGHMSCFQGLTGQVRIAGHADERGTVDYNLALGQRRAGSVKDYLTKGGVSGSRIETTSYGEEQPIDRASNESAWAKNRRAELTATE